MNTWRIQLSTEVALGTARMVLLANRKPMEVHDSGLDQPWQEVDMLMASCKIDSALPSCPEQQAVDDDEAEADAAAFLHGEVGLQAPLT